MENQILSLGASSLLLFGSLQSLFMVEFQDPAKQQTSAPAVQAPQPNDTEKSLLPGQFILQDGTPILLRLSRNVSSVDAHVGDSVDFEVLEDVAVNGILVIPKGSVATGTVTEAQPKRRMGRAGKLEIILDYVRLGDNETVAIRAIKDAKGGNHVAGMTIGIVATGILFFPAAPVFLLMRGNDITVPKGAALAAYVNGDVRLESGKFAAAIAQIASPKPQSWLLQSVHVVGDLGEGFRRTCLIVSPNGEYHREERRQVSGGGLAQFEWEAPEVFEGKLTEADRNDLLAILATPEFSTITGVVGDSGGLRHKLVSDMRGSVKPHKEIEIVTITAARSNMLQLFELADIQVAQQQEPVREFLDWVKGTERRQAHRFLASQATDCSATDGSSVGGGPMDVGITFPKLIYAPEPQLPHDTPKPQPIAVELLINPDGSVAKASVHSHVKPDVAQNVLDTLRKWKFQPARLLGVPIADTIHLRVVNFRDN